MAGPRVEVQYHSEDGNTYRTSVPEWVNTICSFTAATTQPALPKGVRRRRRFVMLTASGKEKSFVVADPASTCWTSGFGAAVTGGVPQLGSGTNLAATYSGRTGERDKNI